MSVQMLRNDPADPSEVALVIDLLRARFGDRISTSEAVRRQHGKDESYHPSVPPDAVFFAQTAAEIAEVVTLCAAHKVPVIPYAAGTSLEGQVAALRGGISIDVNRMNRILRISVAD